MNFTNLFIRALRVNNVQISLSCKRDALLAAAARQVLHAAIHQFLNIEKHKVGGEQKVRSLPVLVGCESSLLLTNVAGCGLYCSQSAGTCLRARSEATMSPHLQLTLHTHQCGCI